MEQLLYKAHVRRLGLKRESILLYFFGFLFFLILLRLFSLQVIQGKYYRQALIGQHYTTSELKAERGNIFVTDRSGKKLQLTENVEFFNLFVDPKFVEDKKRVIGILTPIIYEHFCIEFGLQKTSKLACIENLQKFVGKNLLPEKNSFYSYSGNNLVFINSDEYETQVRSIVDGFSTGDAYALIEGKLDTAIQSGIKSQNYIGFYDNDALLDALRQPPFSAYVNIVNEYYVYIIPDRVGSIQTTHRALKGVFAKHGINISDDTVKAAMEPQEIRYIRLVTNMNAKVAKMIKDAKREYFNELVNGIPLLHGLGLEEYQRRYYPHGQFLSHILGYVDAFDNAFYGVEEYFDSLLGGQDGRIIGLATPWIGQIGANSFEIADPTHGSDVYLTIDPVIQKELESTLQRHQEEFRADSIATVILEPDTGKVVAMANAPTFNPNEYNQAYKLRPLTYNERYIIDDQTYIDIPVFILSGEDLRQATTEERTDPAYQKYIFDNYLGPQIFVDKNISFPYEPGSIFKAITLAVGLDSDSIGLYEFYNDPGFVDIGPFTISNIDAKCEGDNTFMHALGFSCNVGMVRIAQKMTKYIFYPYLEKLGFGQKTTIELAGEESGTLPDFNTISVARFFNNTFGQGLLATPLQMATAYGALVNGGEYIQPTIVETIYDPNTSQYLPRGTKHGGKIFKTITSQQMKEALVSVVDEGGLQKYKREGYALGGKTGTSEIAFRGKYQGGAGRTNGSLVGMVTANNTKYIIAIQVRRPRISPRGADTAGKVFDYLANYLITYENIDS